MDFLRGIRKKTVFKILSGGSTATTYSGFFLLKKSYKPVDICMNPQAKIGDVPPVALPISGWLKFGLYLAPSRAPRSE